MNEGSEHRATIRLWGHGRVDARLVVDRYPGWAWAARIVGFSLIWTVGTIVTLIVTFDPFVACFPLVLGAGLVYRGVRGRYTVREFEGHCPRCRSTLDLPAGSKIPLPLVVPCYSCHFEPQIHLGDLR
jgi:hypothetical protein